MSSYAKATAGFVLHQSASSTSILSSPLMSTLPFNAADEDVCEEEELDEAAEAREEEDDDDEAAQDESAALAEAAETDKREEEVADEAEDEEVTQALLWPASQAALWQSFEQ